MTHSRTLRRNNVRIIGDGPQTMIFAHGFGTDQTAWEEQIAAFAASHRLILFDHVGAGGSEIGAYTTPRYSHLNGYALDLLSICMALDVQQAIYVGHSMSAMVGMRAALVQPQRFARLIFLNGSPRYVNDGAYIGGFTQADLDQLYDAMAANYQQWAGWFAPQVMRNADRPKLAERFAYSLAGLRPDIAQATARVIFQSDERASLPALGVPTLVVQSSADLAVPEEVGRYLVANIPRARLSVIDAEGHLPHMSVPHAVNQTIREYLEQPI